MPTSTKQRDTDASARQVRFYLRPEDEEYLNAEAPGDDNDWTYKVRWLIAEHKKARASSFPELETFGEWLEQYEDKDPVFPPMVQAIKQFIRKQKRKQSEA